MGKTFHNDWAFFAPYPLVPASPRWFVRGDLPMKAA
jgi:hypothetical protein